MKIFLYILAILAASVFAAWCCAQPTSQPATQSTPPITITVADHSLSALNAATTKVAKQAGRPTILRIPPGDYPIPSVWRLTDVSNVDVIGEGVTLRMIAPAPTDANGDLLALLNCHNVKFHGPTLDGGPPRPWTETPMNLRVLSGSDIEIYGVRSIHAPTDDFFVWGGSPNGGYVPILPTNVKIHDCTGDGANRNGCSITGADGCTIWNCRFTNIHEATSLSPQGPWCAIDVEPVTSNPPTQNVRIFNLIIAGCDGGIYLQTSTSLSLSNSVITGGVHGVEVFGANGAVIERIVTDQDVGLNSCDGCRIDSVVAASIYADTHGVANPVGHTIASSVAAKIDTTYCYGHVVLSGNVTK